MPDQQFVVVVYDISNDRRRTRLHTVLLDYGSPVQYSVFECLLDEKDLTRMRDAVNKVIRPRADHVRFYYLCATCVKRVQVTSGMDVLSDDVEPIII